MPHPKSVAIEKIKNSETKLHSEAAALRANIVQFAKEVAKMDLPEAAKKTALESLLSTMGASVEIKYTLEGFVKAIDDLPDGLDLAALDAKMEANMKARLAERSVDDDGDYKQLAKILTPDDDDVVIDETQDVQESSLIDPYTQKFFVKPYKSKKCCHTYSYQVVQHLFKQPNDCIYPGCNQKLGPNDFVRDYQMETMLKAYERQQASAASQAVDMDEDEDDAL